MDHNKKRNQKSSAESNNGDGVKNEAAADRTIKNLKNFPFRSFAELRKEIDQKNYSIGVEPLAAAQWSAVYNSGVKKTLVSALSILLIVAALAAIIVAILFENYWLFLALPIQAVVFYLSHSNTSLSLWVTVAGGVSLLVFFDLLLNRLPTAATLVAYAGLTFACVRAANSITNNAFRKALSTDEDLFIETYKNRACTLREAKTKEIFEYDTKA